MKKTYFVAPNFDIAPPPDGPLDLGHIIPGPDAPDIEPLDQDGYIAITNKLPTMTRTGFTSTRKQLLAGKLGIWAQVMASIGVHASVEFEGSSDDIIKVDTLETQTFQPSLDYVNASCQATGVSRYLQQSSYKFPVYMITGLKIARGCSMTNGKSRYVAGSGGVDLPLEGAQLGPKADFKRSRTEEESFEASSDFVLAFRIQRIRFRLKDGELEIRDRATFVKGATMLEDGAGGGKASIEISGLDETADDLPREVKSLDGVYVDTDDEGQICDLVTLR